MQRAKLFAYVKQQHTNHMEDDIKRILQDKQFHLQLKSEQKEIIQNVLERKRFNGSVTHGLRKEHVLRQYDMRMCITMIAIKIIHLRIHTKVQAMTLSFFIHTYDKSNNLI
jgi:hypothetical protein